ncbi:MAG: MerR family transcriptional regulator [Oscillospiraceae bacterium]|nr:MerR family transcriptional regulator [Oscillospiraceae bacterium]
MRKTLSIQELSKISDIEASTLRYWDEIELFSPVARNPENNYRHYTLAQLHALNFVTTLSSLDIPLKVIADLREQRDPEKLLLLLQKIEKRMDMEMRNLRYRYSVIHSRRELIQMGMRVDENKVSVEYLDEREMIMWPRNEYKDGDTFLDPLAKHIAHLREYQVSLSFPVGGRHDDMETFISRPGCPDNFFSLDPIGTYVRKAGNFLVGYARGYYGELGDLPERMAAYALENDIILAGPVFTIYLQEEICTVDPSQYLAKCCIAVSDKR